MKLVIIIPALNEERTVGAVIAGLPRVPGFSKQEIVVIDDGSADRTAEVAEKAGAQVVPHGKRRGLAAAFRTGLAEAKRLGADVVACIDADGQYDPKQMPLVAGPVARGEADLVLGRRLPPRPGGMPLQKYIGNRLATLFVSLLCQRWFNDAQTGFRAFSMRAVGSMDLRSRFTYTQESLMQCAYNGMKIKEVRVLFKPRQDKPRLFGPVREYALRAFPGIAVTFLRFHPALRGLFS